MGLFFFFAILILQSPSGLPWGLFLLLLSDLPRQSLNSRAFLFPLSCLAQRGEQLQ